MKHARGYKAYCATTRQDHHRPDHYPIEWINDLPCCGLCAFPLAGVTETEAETRQNVKAWEQARSHDLGSLAATRGDENEPRN